MEASAVTVGPERPDRSERPFGAHLHLRWWAPLLVVTVPPVAMVLLQILLFAGAALVEGGGHPPEALTPGRFLAVNLSMGLTGLLTVPFVARLAGVPWRTVLSFPRAIELRRLTTHLGVAVALFAVANLAMGALAPEATTWTGFGITGTTILLLLAVVLTTPLQAAAEELMFRGAVLPATASWVRAVRPALVLGVVLSTVAFAIVHGSADPWLLSYYGFFGLCAALMAVISRGLEAPIAFHIGHNAVTATLNAVLADGGALVVDRAVGAGGPHLLLLVPVNLLAVGLVWWDERRRARPGS